MPTPFSFRLMLVLVIQHMETWVLLFLNWDFIRTVEKGGPGGEIVPSLPPLPHHFLELNFLSHVKSEKFLHVNNMWDFSLFIKQDISDKK